MCYPRCNTLAVRTRDVAPRPARITDITLSRNSCARRHLLSCNRHPLARKKVKESKGQEFWVHIYLTTSCRPRWRCVQSLVQIGLEMWICIRSVQTNKQTFIFNCKIILWDHRCICGLSLTETSLCGAYLYCKPLTHLKLWYGCCLLITWRLNHYTKSLSSFATTTLCGFSPSQPSLSKFFYP